MVYYLNSGWRELEHGGSLLIWKPDYSEALASIPPLLDRAIFFWSDRRIPHEVLPARRARFATQIWFHNNEQAAPQDDAEYRATLGRLSQALRTKAHVQVRTIDHSLSDALEALCSESATGPGDKRELDTDLYDGASLRWIDSASVTEAFFAWLHRLADGIADGTSDHEAPAGASQQTLFLLRVGQGETRWLPMLEGARELVLVRLAGDASEGQHDLGISAHCLPSSKSGWPNADDAPVEVETTPGRGAVFLHVFNCGALTTCPAGLHLRARGPVALAGMFTIRQGQGGSSLTPAELARRQAQVAVMTPAMLPSSPSRNAVEHTLEHTVDILEHTEEEEEKGGGGVEDFSNEGLTDDEAAELLRQMRDDTHPASELILTGNRLTSLPSEIGEQRTLLSLRLGGNQLSTLPEAIGALRSLTFLGANCNRICELPAAIGVLASLESLRLHGNRLERLPASICNLRSLRSLALGANQLDELPDAIGSLQTLTMLALNCNRLKALPDDICRLARLQVLSVDGNSLTALPGAFGDLTALTTLNANGNRLETFPDTLVSLRSLTALHASGNRLARLPASIHMLAALQSLNLAFNLLTTLPDGIGRLESLRSVNLSANSFGRRLSIALGCKTLWMDYEVERGPEVRFFRLILGTAKRDMPYVNFLQSTPEGNARALVVAFGVSGFDFGGVIDRARADVDVLFLFDQHHSSYTRDEGKLRDFLLEMRTRYARVGAIGSSQAAFGALHYCDCVDDVLAISPLSSAGQELHISEESNWLPRRGPQRACHVSIHVAEENYLDMQYANFCETTHHHRPGEWLLRIVKHAGAGHPAYPGDSAVQQWAHGLKWRRVLVAEDP